MGEWMSGAFRSRLQGNEGIRDIRGRGLMIGIELDRDVNHFKTDALDQGLLLNITRNNIIRLLPPLIIDQAQAEQIVDTVCRLIESLE
jgi:acetylornithine aminotransferase